VQERTHQLETANRELEAFTYSVSHDLRAIDGMSLALAEDCADQLPAEGLAYVARIRTATQRMGQIIDDLLTLSRITRNELRTEQLDLSRIAHEVALELQQTDPTRHVTWTIAPGIQVVGDPQLMHVALTDLIGNAWKFTSQRSDARIEVGRTQMEGQPCYFVRDNGVGFDMAYAGKLFGAFQRLHAANEFEGTGIGLATVQRIILRHGGLIWARAEVNKGATFYFTLPGNEAHGHQRQSVTAR
jgi:light-regulated signal transduction histidine kinase (bacteriophytochrome)